MGDGCAKLGELKVHVDHSLSPTLPLVVVDCQLFGDKNRAFGSGAVRIQYCGEFDRGCQGWLSKFLSIVTASA